MNYDDVKNAISGYNIGYVNLAENLDAMSKNIANAIQEEQVKCIIAISSIAFFDDPLVVLWIITTIASIVQKV